MVIYSCRDSCFKERFSHFSIFYLILWLIVSDAVSLTVTKPWVQTNIGTFIIHSTYTKYNTKLVFYYNNWSFNYQWETCRLFVHFLKWLYQEIKMQLHFGSPLIIRQVDLIIKHIDSWKHAAFHCYIIRNIKKHLIRIKLQHHDLFCRSVI